MTERVLWWLRLWIAVIAIGFVIWGYANRPIPAKAFEPLPGYPPIIITNAVEVPPHDH